MSRPPPSRNSLLPPIVLSTVVGTAFLAGALLILLPVSIVTAAVGWPYDQIVPWRSMKRVIILLTHPVFGSMILCGEIATAVWAVIIAWRALKPPDE